MNSRSNRRAKRMPRKRDDEWAVLALMPAKLTERMKAKDLSTRDMARLCGHASHTHIYRLTTGATKTTSIDTANVMEAVLDLRGILFARMSTKTADMAGAA